VMLFGQLEVLWLRISEGTCSLGQLERMIANIGHRVSSNSFDTSCSSSNYNFIHQRAGYEAGLSTGYPLTNCVQRKRHTQKKGQEGSQERWHRR
jgi:hypothetical protein